MRLLVTLILIAAAYCGLAWDQIPFLVDDEPAPSRQVAAPRPPITAPAKTPAQANAPAKVVDSASLGPWTAFADARALADARLLRGYGENR
jgi:hypothetical protein